MRLANNCIVFLCQFHTANQNFYKFSRRSGAVWCRTSQIVCSLQRFSVISYAFVLLTAVDGGIKVKVHPTVKGQDHYDLMPIPLLETQYHRTSFGGHLKSSHESGSV